MIGTLLAAEIESLARAQLGDTFRVETVTPVHGGDISPALCVAGGGWQLFVKLRPAADRDMFDAEADGLAALAANTSFRIPRVLGICDTEQHSALILEWLDVAPLRNAHDASRAGEALAAMHAIPQPRFGWPRDNYIGSTPQTNPETDNWARFFAQHRLTPQLQRAAQQGFGGDLQRNGERVCERLPAFFLEYHPAPSLIHGDLWSGNVGVLPDGTPALFDPACYCGDREAELAMTELFGGFPMAFYAAYRAALPLHDDYERRKPIYNLYHVLNHLNLFGRGYLGQAERMLEQLAR